MPAFTNPGPKTHYSNYDVIVNCFEHYFFTFEKKAAIFFSKMSTEAIYVLSKYISFFVKVKKQTNLNT